MNLTLESLLILDMIDRKGSFAAAAVALDRVPSALTYSVRKLEDDLDGEDMADLFLGELNRLWVEGALERAA